MDSLLRRILWKNYYYRRKLYFDEASHLPPIETGGKTYFGNIIRENDICCSVCVIKIDKNESFWLLPEEIDKFCEIYTMIPERSTFGLVVKKIQ